MKPKISIYVAIDKKRGIGKSGTQPFYIRDDLKRFKEATTGHPVIMGRRTLEAILSYRGKPLPDRTNIVITHDKSFQHEGVTVCHSLDEAIEKAKEIENPPAGGEIFIIGGGQIFEQALHSAQGELVSRIYLTVIDHDFECDVFFPDYSEFKKVLSEEQRETEDGLKYKWLTLERA